jgi:hypothetical protein
MTPVSSEKPGGHYHFECEAGQITVFTTRKLEPVEKGLIQVFRLGALGFFAGGWCGWREFYNRINHDQPIIVPGKTLWWFIREVSIKFYIDGFVGLTGIGLVIIKQGFLDLRSRPDPVLSGRVTGLKTSDLVSPGVMPLIDRSGFAGYTQETA